MTFLNTPTKLAQRWAARSVLKAKHPMFVVGRRGLMTSFYADAMLSDLGW